MYCVYWVGSSTHQALDRRSVNVELKPEALPIGPRWAPSLLRQPLSTYLLLAQ